MTWENRLTFEVLGDVRNSNPYFESDASDWVAAGAGATVARSTIQQHEGVASLLITSPGGVATVGAQTITKYAVVALQTYTARAWVYSPTGWSDVRTAIDWWDSSSVFLSSGLPTTTVVPAASWTLISNDLVAPAGAAFGVLRVRVGGTPAAVNLVYADEVTLSNVAEAGAIWVDLTTRIRDQIQPVTSQSGRQNDLDQAEPGRLDLLLENSDDALTYGNTASPYPWWGPGRKCRLRETVAGVVMDRLTAYLQVPTELLITAPVDPADSREQRVSITAVDRLGRLASAEPFVSTLTEHIGYNGGAALLAHWPLADASGSTGGASVTSGVGPLRQVVRYNDDVFSSQVLWSTRRGPAGEDASYVQWNPTDKSAGATTGGPRLARRDISVPLTAGKVVAILGWIYNPTPSSAFPTGPGQVLTAHGTVTLNPQFYLNVDIGTGWTFHAITSAGNVSVIVPAVRLDGWSAFGMFLDVTSGAMTLCVDGQVGTGNIGPSSTGTLQEIALDGIDGQSFGQIQMYSGDSGQLNTAFFTAQYQAGLTGLERQTTGDRIRTIAQYAGIPAAELTQIDTGSSVMQRATLAGKTPLQAMRDAERTERGLLYVDGSGNLVFKDRRTLYNI